MSEYVKIHLLVLSRFDLPEGVDLVGRIHEYRYCLFFLAVELFERRLQLAGAFLLLSGPLRQPHRKHFEVLSGLKESEKIVAGTYQAIRELKDGTIVRAAKAPDKTKQAVKS